MTPIERNRLGSYKVPAFPLLFWLTQGLGLVIIIFILVYVFEYHGGFGGSTNPNLEFCWHVFFMVFGFVYCLGNSLLVFRFLRNFSKPTLKKIHLGLNGLVLLFSILGLIFIVDMKNVTNRGHFTSYHSWIGITTIILLALQFSSGIFLFSMDVAPGAIKNTFMPWHVKLGIGIFTLGTLSILTAIGEFNVPFVNVMGILVTIFFFLVVNILNDEKLRYSHDEYDNNEAQ